MEHKEEERNIEILSIKAQFVLLIQIKKVK